MKNNYYEIPKSEFEDGIKKIKKNILNFLDSAEILLNSNKKDHASILTEFAIEELGKILMLKDEYDNLSNSIKIPKSVFRTHKGKSERAWQFLNQSYRMISNGGFERSDDGSIGFERGFEQVTFASHNTRLECAFVDFENSKRWYVGRNIDSTKLKEQIKHIQEKIQEL
ncbi:MAG: AbiV family abortive infection protein [Candidatus Bathyarchaeota archaeon]